MLRVNPDLSKTAGSVIRKGQRVPAGRVDGYSTRRALSSRSNRAGVRGVASTAPNGPESHSAGL